MLAATIIHRTRNENRRSCSRSRRASTGSSSLCVLCSGNYRVDLLSILVTHTWWWCTIAATFSRAYAHNWRAPLSIHTVPVEMCKRTVSMDGAGNAIDNLDVQLWDGIF
jgi:hypothetical protein